MKYDTIIFDFDGVIVDSWLGIAKGFITTLKNYNINLTLEEAKKEIGPPFASLVTNRFNISEDKAKEAIITHRTYLREKGIYEATLFKDTFDTLQRLKEARITLAIASNKPMENVMAQVKMFKIEDFFNVIVAQDYYQTKGNKSNLVKEALEKLNATKNSRVLMVGDKETDIIGGRDNECDTAFCKYGYGNEEEMIRAKASYNINSLGELLEIAL